MAGQRGILASLVDSGEPGKGILGQSFQVDGGLHDYIMNAAPNGYLIPSSRGEYRGNIIPLKKNLDTGELSFAVPGILSGAIDSAVSGFTAPYRALTGKLPMTDETGRTSPEAIAAAMDMAGLLSIGGINQAKTISYREPITTGKLAKIGENIYNPPVKPTRSFELDYPIGGIVDDAGKLSYDIEGRPLTARYIAGRVVAGEPDRSLLPGDVAGIAESATGTGIRKVAPGELGRGAMGAVAVNRYSRNPEAVFISKSLSDDQAAKVAAHEVGHVVDQISGEISVDGLNTELRQIYNDLNNPQSYGKKFGPEQSRYKGGEIPRELMAEAIRAYIVDPNYVKTIAPKTAARIREMVNSNPKIKDIVQFNAGSIPFVDPSRKYGNDEFSRAYFRGDAS